MVNKGAQITAIALNPTRQLLAFTERGERPLLVSGDPHPGLTKHTHRWFMTWKRGKGWNCCDALSSVHWRWFFHLDLQFFIYMSTSCYAPTPCIQVVSLAFSHDSKYLLAQGGSPDHQLVYFFWEKGKVGGNIEMAKGRNRLKVCTIWCNLLQNWWHNQDFSDRAQYFGVFL